MMLLLLANHSGNRVRVTLRNPTQLAERKRFKCRCSLPPWLVQRCQDSKVSIENMGQELSSRTVCIQGLALVSRAKLTEDANTEWLCEHEADVLFNFFHRPLDAFGVQIEKLWVFEDPIVVDMVKAASAEGFCAPHIQAAHGQLFYPLHYEDCQGRRLRRVLGGSLSMSTMTLLEIAYDHQNVVPASVFSLEAWQLGINWLMPCVAVAPDIILSLLLKGNWHVLLLLGRWLEWLTQSDRDPTAPRPRREEQRFGAEWAFPSNWFQDWPPREWLARHAFQHDMALTQQLFERHEHGTSSMGSGLGFEVLLQLEKAAIVGKRVLTEEMGDPDLAAGYALEMSSHLDVLRALRNTHCHTPSHSFIYYTSRKLFEVVSVALEVCSAGRDLQQVWLASQEIPHKKGIFWLCNITRMFD